MATLQEKVEEAIALDDRVDQTRVRVTMRGTTAFLEGEVPDLEQYSAAEDAADRVAGVTALVNELVVTGQAVDMGATRQGMGMRSDPSTEVLVPGGLPETRIGPFGVDADEATSIEGETSGGPVGGDVGEPQRPQSPELTAPLGAEAVAYSVVPRLCPYCGSALEWSVDLLECPECGPELGLAKQETEDRTEDYEGEEVLPRPAAPE